jgi:hypothetical protein
MAIMADVLTTMCIGHAFKVYDQRVRDERSKAWAHHHPKSVVPDPEVRSEPDAT